MVVGMVRPVLLALLAFVTAAAAAAQDLAAGSSWKNRRGSILRIETVDTSGAFKGTFEKKGGALGCQGSFDVGGTVVKAHVIFYVTFKNTTRNCNMVTVWRGSVRGSRLSARWDLAHTNTKTGRLRFYKGSDVFSRM